MQKKRNQKWHVLFDRVEYAIYFLIISSLCLHVIYKGVDAAWQIDYWYLNCSGW